jgi:wyosine [tRNA(Phe)-imidazoG37] synthetase (radical SAM superfamily)
VQKKKDTTVLNKRTRSLCNACYEEIPAIVYEENGQVFMKKTCPKHGDFKGLMEKDADFYKWFVDLTPMKHSNFSSLLMPITYKCNMNCSYCFTWFPNRIDPTMEEILSAARDFPGKGIALTGGEPTTREDLARLIEALRVMGKFIYLVTNGLKIADISYLRSLKSAGVNTVYLSIDSFRKQLYQTIKKGASEDVVEIKNRALANLREEKIVTRIAHTVYPGINDDEIADLFNYSLENCDFIEQYRARSCARIGRNRDTNLHGHMLSELVDMFGSQLHIGRDVLKEHLLYKRMGRSLLFMIEGSLEDGSFKLCRTDKISGKINRALSRIGIKPRVKVLQVKLVNWPTVENIDLEEQRTPIGYWGYGNKQITQVYHGMILEEQYD